MEQSTNKLGKRRLIGSIVTVLSFFIIYFITQKVFFTPPTFDKELVQAANELNKNCPAMLDKDTRLDNTATIPGNIFGYYFTLVNMNKSGLDTEKLKEYLIPRIVNNIKTNPDLKIFRDNKTTIEYTYRDKNGEFLFRFSATPKQYNQSFTK